MTNAVREIDIDNIDQLAAEAVQAMLRMVAAMVAVEVARLNEQNAGTAKPVR